MNITLPYGANIKNSSVSPAERMLTQINRSVPTRSPVPNFLRQNAAFKNPDSYRLEPTPLENNMLSNPGGFGQFMKNIQQGPPQDVPTFSPGLPMRNSLNQELLINRTLQHPSQRFVGPAVTPIIMLPTEPLGDSQDSDESSDDNANFKGGR